jgi:hypothetical protein
MTSAEGWRVGRTPRFLVDTVEPVVVAGTAVCGDHAESKIEVIFKK